MPEWLQPANWSEETRVAAALALKATIALLVCIVNERSREQQNRLTE